MCAIELVSDRATKRPAKDETEKFKRLAFERGLITITAGTFGNCIRVLAPLVITDEELAKGLDILEESLKAI
jgi:4-aminobutyrate aminotransferase/(S)-3-amino-2-methylpropionate transaminase